MNQQLSGRRPRPSATSARLVGGSQGLRPRPSWLSTDPLAHGGREPAEISCCAICPERVADGRLHLESLEEQSDEEVITAITGVKGLRRWSAEMFLMFRLNRPTCSPSTIWGS
jgi:hypothetical protein